MLLRAIPIRPSPLIFGACLCATLPALAQTDGGLVFDPSDVIEVEGLTDSEIDALDGTEGFRIPDPCNVAPDDYAILMADALEGEEWLLTFTTGLTETSGLFIPVTENIPPQPSRLEATSDGYDLYVGARQVPMEMSWAPGLTANFDLPAGMQVNGNVPENDDIAALVPCALGDLAALDTGEVARGGGTDRTVMWPLVEGQFMGLSISTRGSATSTMMFILER